MVKGISFGNISIDCQNPELLRDFYANLLGWETFEIYGLFALKSSDGLTLLFMEPDLHYEKPVWPEEQGAQQKQMHLDFHVEDLESAVAEAELLGASKTEAQFGDGHFITMLDPEGHPFCLCA